MDKQKPQPWTRTAKQARGYREDPQFERLRTLPPAERDALLDRLGPSYRTAYGFYLSGRQAATDLAKEPQR